MPDKRNTASSGVGFTGLLAIAFIVLRLTNAIAWSWWWVLAPLWISFILVLVMLVIIYAILK